MNAAVVSRSRRRPRRVASNDPSAIEVAELPSYGFGDHSLMWWGTWGIILIEGTVFALAIATYFYLRTRVINWPPSLDFPGPLWGTINLAIVLASAIPNQWAKRAGERQDLAGCRQWTWVLLAFAIATLIVRIFEFKSLNCRWDTNAYGSIVWMLLGLHTLHLVTDAYDTAVLGVLLITGPLEGKRFGDVAENALYWNFVILAWIPIYLVIYIAPRVI
ncbi:MAG TPA: cytochrome c oxidase subunit 3 [Casimicrobiaceae bacterium]|nr:cytochrome c oxidase subunit 3 [Casimicrobiaceae bacterium]